MGWASSNSRQICTAVARGALDVRHGGRARPGPRGGSTFPPINTGPGKSGVGRRPDLSPAGVFTPHRKTAGDEGTERGSRRRPERWTRMALARRISRSGPLSPFCVCLYFGKPPPYLAAVDLDGLETLRGRHRCDNSFNVGTRGDAGTEGDGRGER